MRKNCGQACPYNTLDGCKVKEYNAICPLTNMATPITEYRMTNADRIRSMTDAELATDLLDMFEAICEDGVPSKEWMLDWLKRPAETYSPIK